MTGQNTDGETGWSPSRRAVLGSLGAAGAVSIAGCGFLSSDDDDDADDAVTIGVSIPQQGRLSDTGQQLHDGYRLAVEHISSGTGAFTAGPWAADIDEGILGREVELDIRDTESSASGASDTAQILVNEGADMITGGASPEEGLRHQEVASDEEIVYLGGYTNTDSLAGRDCSRYAFNEMYNPSMAAQALVEPVYEALGRDENITFTQLFPDTGIGSDMSRTFQSAFDDIGWSQAERYRTRVGTRDFSDTAEEALGTAADVYILNYSGWAASSALNDLVSEADDEVTVVIPFLNHVTMANSGDALETVYGTVQWTQALDDSFSQAFADSWDDLNTAADVPTDLAHLAYVQVCQYAAAAERAGSLEPDDVVDELEGYSYDIGLGNQESELRSCDHQAMRGIPVVSGRPTAGPGNYTELIDVRSRDEVAYSCDSSPAADCDI